MNGSPSSSDLDLDEVNARVQKMEDGHFGQPMLERDATNIARS